MSVAYWTLAALLALIYLFSGASKLTRSKEQLRPMMGWVDTTPMPAVRALGAVEVLGAIGLVLPPLAGVAEVLAVAAAVGLAVVQAGALVLHVSRRELSVIWLNVVLLVAAVAAAWLGAGTLL
ncbi:DoxX family protein [Streptomyces sp. NPDC093085]|uniref:DoxX family protein n=1 Tax=Streptomyces sp. NPDC093085 TaxID=3155068 RepID=UPI00341CC926